MTSWTTEISRTVALSLASVALLVGGSANAGVHSAHAVRGLGASEGICDVTKWRLKPQNGTPDDTQGVVIAVPDSDVTVRASGPGGFAATRRGVGQCAADAAACVVDADCAANCVFKAHATVSSNTLLPVATAWSASEAWQAGSSSGVAVESNQSIEFRFSSLTADTEYRWKFQCQDSNGKWGKANDGLGNGSFRTIPASGADACVRIVIDTDPHIVPAYFSWIESNTADADDSSDQGLCVAGTAAGTVCDEDSDCPSSTCSCPTDNTTAESVEDCDRDGWADANERYLRNLNTIDWMKEQGNILKSHWHENLGDFHQSHCNNCSSNCGSPAAFVGPCLDEFGTDLTYGDGHDDTVATQLLRSLGYDGLSAMGNAVGYFDDEIEWSQARIGFASNRYNPVWRSMSSLMKSGNHEGHAAYGTITCEAEHCNGATGSRGGNMKTSVRMATRSMMHNPNDFYPTSQTSEDDEWEEQGFYWAFESGNALFIYLDEYIQNLGQDESGEFFSAGTTFDDTECLGSEDPVTTCSGAGTGRGDSMPVTPWEWTLGTAQKAWLTSTLNASSARYVKVAMHHLTGGTGLGNAYDYGRGGCGSTLRHCRDVTDDSLVTFQTGTSPATLDGSWSDGDSIPCWGGNANTVNHESLDEIFCDWADNDTDDDSAYCEDLDYTADFSGEWEDIHEELKAYATANSATVLVTIGHDHLMSYCHKIDGTTESNVHYWNLGQSGDGMVTGWANNAGFQSFHDYNLNGIAEYRAAQYIKDDELQSNAHTETLEPTVVGWDGKGFGTISICPDGMHLKYMATPGADACYGTGGESCDARDQLDGQVVWRKTLVPN